MKKILILALILTANIVFVISCKSNSEGTGEGNMNTKKDSASTPVASEEMNYPYTIEHPDNWVPGSNQNTYNVLQSLKSWENMNIDECLKYFADSVHVQFDGIDKWVSKDTLRSMITPANDTKGIVVKMEDWESVISKDKNDEYVTLWYKQIVEKNNGKKDSVDVVNDFKIKNGKIIALDEYRRRFH